MMRVNKLNNKGLTNMNMVVSETLDNSGTLNGNWMAYFGSDLKNSGSIDYSQLIMMPNLTEVHNTGTLHTGMLFVHEDVVQEFNQSQYDKLIVIPHHDEMWDTAAGDNYLNAYIDAHPQDFPE